MGETAVQLLLIITFFTSTIFVMCTGNNPRNISVSTDKRSWLEANTTCHVNNQSLLSNLNSENMENIISIFKMIRTEDFLESPGLWIGLSKMEGEQKFRWDDCTLPDVDLPWTVDHSFWDSYTETTRSSETGNNTIECVALMWTVNKLQVVDCSIKYPFICETPKDSCHFKRYPFHKTSLPLLNYGVLPPSECQQKCLSFTSASGDCVLIVNKGSDCQIGISNNSFIESQPYITKAMDYIILYGKICYNYETVDYPKIAFNITTITKRNMCTLRSAPSVLVNTVTSSTISSLMDSQFLEISINKVMETSTSRSNLYQSSKLSMASKRNAVHVYFTETHDPTQETSAEPKVRTSSTFEISESSNSITSNPVFGSLFSHAGQEQRLKKDGSNTVHELLAIESSHKHPSNNDVSTSSTNSEVLQSVIDFETVNKIGLGVESNRLDIYSSMESPFPYYYDIYFRSSDSESLQVFDTVSEMLSVSDETLSIFRTSNQVSWLTSDSSKFIRPSFIDFNTQITVAPHNESSSNSHENPVLFSEKHTNCNSGSLSSGNYQTAAISEISTEEPCKRICFCKMSNSSGVGEEVLKDILQELYVDKMSLSSTRRRLTSADDDRPTAAITGRLGVTVLVGVFCFMIFLDFQKVVAAILKFQSPKINSPKSLS